jgi:hypothetical protein
MRRAMAEAETQESFEQPGTSGGEIPSVPQISRTKRAVIISVPFYRIARVSLSPVVLSALARDAAIIIVAPFAGHPVFENTFRGSDTTFVEWRAPVLGRIARFLFAISEIMRRNGYWRRFRHEGTAYYVANQFAIFGENGADRRLSVLHRAAFAVLAIFGQWRRSWRVADRLLGSSWCEQSTLTSAVAGYREVTLIQSANWGMQDHALATLSRTHGWRRVLLPYTNDQLDVNGFLLNDFDAVCVQGTYENRRARERHNVPPSHIHQLGSVWFRHLDEIREKVLKQDSTAPRGGPTPETVIYAGSPRLSFPREVELAAVDAIYELVRGYGDRYLFVYRPIEHWTEEDKQWMRERFAGKPGLKLEFPDIAAAGLDGYTPIDHERSLQDYVRRLLSCRVLVMSLTTTLAMDVAYLRRAGVVANMIDPQGILRRRHTHLLNLAGFPGIHKVHSLEELQNTVKYMLDNPKEVERESAEIIAQWDYRSDFASVLRKAVFARVPEALARAH